MVEQDAVDRIVTQWHTVRPDLDSSPIGVVGRLSRLSRLIDRRLAENFATFGLENWMYDVLATLRRHGEPYELTAGELMSRSMVTTGSPTCSVIPRSTYHCSACSSSCVRSSQRAGRAGPGRPRRC